ncbi:SWI/SNF chromatin-remodeling complex subunit [Pseudocyphellaria aurata]|nr:SWI/SNF chromatin-remodeling complex subunit [Pseudocyphellaria aurata]
MPLQEQALQQEGAMDPPTSSVSAVPHPSTPQSPSSGRQQREGQPTVPIHSIQPHATEHGWVDAVGPPGQENPVVTPPHKKKVTSTKNPPVNQPPCPIWLKSALDELQNRYSHDVFKGTMRYIAVNTTSDLPISVRRDAPLPPDNVKHMYRPYIKCDCRRKLYTLGPELGLADFEVHLKFRIHREQVERTIAAADVSATTSGSGLNGEEAS